MGKTKKKFEFSKLILFVFGVIEVGVVLFTCYMVHLTCDLTPLAYDIDYDAIADMIDRLCDMSKIVNATAPETHEAAE